MGGATGREGGGGGNKMHVAFVRAPDAERPYRTIEYGWQDTWARALWGMLSPDDESAVPFPECGDP